MFSLRASLCLLFQTCAVVTSGNPPPRRPTVVMSPSDPAFTYGDQLRVSCSISVKKKPISSSAYNSSCLAFSLRFYGNSSDLDIPVDGSTVRILNETSAELRFVNVTLDHHLAKVFCYFYRSLNSSKNLTNPFEEYQIITVKRRASITRYHLCTPERFVFEWEVSPPDCKDGANYTSWYKYEDAKDFTLCGTTQNCTGPTQDLCSGMEAENQCKINSLERLRDPGTNVTLMINATFRDEESVSYESSPVRPSDTLAEPVRNLTVDVVTNGSRVVKFCSPGTHQFLVHIRVVCGGHDDIMLDDTFTDTSRPYVDDCQHQYTLKDLQHDECQIAVRIKPQLERDRFGEYWSVWENVTYSDRHTPSFSRGVIIVGCLVVGVVNIGIVVVVFVIRRRFNQSTEPKFVRFSETDRLQSFV